MEAQPRFWTPAASLSSAQQSAVRGSPVFDSVSALLRKDDLEQGPVCSTAASVGRYLQSRWATIEGAALAATPDEPA